MMHYTKEIMDQFVLESKKYLESIEEDLYELEKYRHSPAPTLIDKIFRIHHTIKEGAGFLGLKNINDLALMMENMLSMLRAGEIKPEPVIVNALMEGANSLNAMLDDVEHSNEVDISPVYKQMSDLLSGEISEDVKHQLNTNVILFDLRGEKTGFEINQFTLKNLTARHWFLYVLKFDLMELADQKKKTPLQLIRQLLRQGEIIEGSLQAELEDLHAGLPRQPLIYQVLYATTLDYVQLQEAAGLTRGDIIFVKMPAQGPETAVTCQPYEVFKDHILPGLCESLSSNRDAREDRDKSRVRIWSVGAPTGLELYLIAVFVYEYVTAHKREISGSDISILSTDISPEALAGAISGKFNDKEIDQWFIPEKKTEYFRRSGTSWIIKDHIRSMLNFRQINPAAPFTFLGKFDVIFCHNILNSFDSGTTKEIVAQFHAVLLKKGFLFPGSGGHLPRLKGKFEPLKYGETTIYKKI